MFEIFYDDMEKELFWTPVPDTYEYKVELSQGGSSFGTIYQGTNLKIPLDIDPMPSPVVVVISKRESGGSPFEEKGRKILK